MTTSQGKHAHTADSCKEDIEDACPSLRSLVENEASTDRSQSDSKSADALEAAEDMRLAGQCIGHENAEQARTELACSTSVAPESEEEGSTMSNRSEMNKLVVSEEEGGGGAAAAKNDKIQSVSEVAVPDAAASTPASSSFHQSHDGDLNFSGPRGSSGHIPYSGSISMRSDSSATSTRSFTFPILPREWNASPVKMAKARKHRWRLMGLKCCKF